MTILVGAPLSGYEARFLHTLHADLGASEALILANFVVAEQQIDFLVVTPTYAAHLELKNFPRPVFGDRNGRWLLLDAGGTRVPYPGANPWHQALKQKYALSDEMREYQSRARDVPPPSGSYFKDFASFVCVYPAIHPASGVTEGDHKVHVASYADVVEVIRGDAKSSSWSINDWRLFAQQRLNLTPCTLQEATDAKFLEATERVRSYCARVADIVGCDLPPLIAREGHELYGSDLVSRTLTAENFLLTGPTGSAKTFHLHHIVLATAKSGNEVPILVEAKRYRGGDFWTLLRQSTAPYFREDPKSLMEAARIGGFRPVLVIDALNETSEESLLDLLKGAQAFALRHEARVIMTSQRCVTLSAELKAENITLPLPDANQKRAIYCYHANVAPTNDLDGFCAAFANTYDLTIAGRCHALGSPPASRAILYDRYVRHCLARHAPLLSEFLRTVAERMGVAITLVFARDEFERAWECFAHENKLPLDLLQTIQSTRLVRISEDLFEFEHELLLHYFRAEALRRDLPEIAQLAAALGRPRNHPLAEFVVSRFQEPEDTGKLLDAVVDPDLLARVCRGECGAPAQRALLGRCRRLLAAALDDLKVIEVNLALGKAQDGRRYLADVLVRGVRTWTANEARLCHVIAENLDHPELQGEFLALLDATEWALRSAVHVEAKGERLRVAGVWGEVVRVHGGLLERSEMVLPYATIATALRHLQMRWFRNEWTFPLRDQFVERVYRNPQSYFALLLLLEDQGAARSVEHIDQNVELAKEGWRSGVYILRIGAVQYLESMRSAVLECGEERVRQICDLLESFETDDLMINTTRLEALAAYGALELSLGPEDALQEMRSLISRDARNNPATLELAAASETTVEECIAALALSCLGKIFEDVSQGIYYEAYSDLTNEEKCDILCLAAGAREGGFLADWIVRELLRLGDARALPVLQRYASCVRLDINSPQEAVAAYLLGIEGCARWSDEPPTYEGDDSAPHQAWRVIGRILFWAQRPTQSDCAPRTAALWRSLQGEVLVAASDVLYYVANSDRLFGDRRHKSFDLIAAFPKEARRVAEAGLVHEGLTPSLFPYFSNFDGGLKGFLITTLGRLADETAIPLLRRFVDDAKLGKRAIEAIERINGAALQGRAIQ